MTKLSGFDPDSDLGIELQNIFKMYPQGSDWQCKAPQASLGREKIGRITNRSLFLQWAPIWNDLSEQCQQGWIEYWIGTGNTPNTGAGGWPGSGFSGFVEFNAQRYRQGLPPKNCYQPDPSDWRPIFFGEGTGGKRGTYGNGIFMLGEISGQGRIWTSADGENWTQKTSPFNDGIGAIGFGNGEFLAVRGGQSQVFAISTDGNSWQLHDAPIEESWASAVYGAGRWAIGSTHSNSRIISTADFQSYTSYNDQKVSSWRKGIFAEEEFLFGSNLLDTHIARSSTGTFWTDSTGDTGILIADIAYGNGIYIIVGFSKTARSFNSENWVDIVSPGTTNINSLTYGNGIFRGTTSSTPRRIISTFNGLTWQVDEINSLLALTEMIYGNEKWLAIPVSSPEEEPFLFINP